MKNIILLSLLISVNHLFGQNYIDYCYPVSENLIGGTARNISMGGAFGSIGGDFSSLSYNPAGIALFKNSQLTISPGFSFSNSKSNYLESEVTNEIYNLNINNFGLVFSKYDETKEKGISFGFGFNRLNDYNYDVLFQAQNNNQYNSLVDNFLSTVNDKNGNALVTPYSLDPFRSNLAYQGYIIDYYIDSLLGPFWTSDRVPQSDILQTINIISEGRKNEWVFSLGGNVNNSLFLGGTFGIQSFNMVKKNTHRENYIDSYDGLPGWFTLSQRFSPSGTGFNFKFGMIYKITDFIRISAAIHSPTFFSINEEYYENNNQLESAYITNVIFPMDTSFNRIIQPDDSYMFRTPMREMVGIAFQFGQTGLLSIDYELVNYSGMRYSKGEYSDFISVNQRIIEDFRTTHNIRIGGEMKLNDVIAFRAGYAFYESPNKSKDISFSGNNHIMSYGIGFNKGYWGIDFAYSYTFHKQQDILYTTPDPYFSTNTLVNVGEYNLNPSRFVSTLTFKF